MFRTRPLGQFEPIVFETVPDSICAPNRATRVRFEHPHYTRTLYLWVPSVLEDKIMRSLAVKGYQLYDIYRLGMGTDYIPEAALRPCIKNALLYRYYDMDEGAWKSAPGKFTCDSYYRCFQEYTSAYEVRPAENPLDRRMQIAPNVFTPSPNEEKCIREKFLMSNNLYQSYEACGCPEIFPMWPNAVNYVSNALRLSPATNMYYILKDHYMTTTVATTYPPATVIPDSAISPIPVSPGLVEPDQATLIKESEEIEARQRVINIIAGAAGVLIAWMLIKDRR